MKQRSAKQRSAVERTDDRIFRYRVLYIADPDEGMDLETMHMTRIGARLSRWLWR